VSDKPIFIRGVSRSGGTLLVTILDVHPEIAMSYELYPDLLYSRNKDNKFLHFLTNIKMRRLINLFDKYTDTKLAAKKIKNKNLRTFFLRCLRANLDSKDLSKLLKQHILNGQDFSDVEHCLKFIGQCGIEKMKKMNKSRWGMKCTSQFHDYARMWPGAYFLNIIRDGRDVLASQLNTGKFNRTPSETARRWVETHRNFRTLAGNPDINTYEVYYEKLVMHPEEELKKICEFLNIPFEKSMLDYYKKDLTIFKEPTGHLSYRRITKPIDDSMIGRWKKDVNERQLKEFYSIAGETMVELGYLDAREAHSL
jgi:hypothetical protein